MAFHSWDIALPFTTIGGCMNIMMEKNWDSFMEFQENPFLVSQMVHLGPLENEPQPSYFFTKSSLSNLLRTFLIFGQFEPHLLIKKVLIKKNECMPQRIGQHHVISDTEPRTPSENITPSR